MENAKKNYQPIIRNDSSKEDNFTSQIYTLKQTNGRLKGGENTQTRLLGNNSMADSYGNLELNRTLAHDSAHIPLQVFDQNGKQVSGD
mmetsp:Transcript_10944/g.9438  ORF Transcript_10944/g.9438 Transcript_10944/m.9438 type:complete len:88 (+) Transcript_10944:2208-2471(+)